VVSQLGSGRAWGARFTYRVQDDPGGIAQALGLAQDFAGGQSLVAILGDNIFSDPITPYVQRFTAQGRGARILLKEVPDPERYGVAEVSDGVVLGIEEKPAHPKSRLCVTGIYMFDPTVFEIIHALVPSGRGELEISDVNNQYIRAGTMRYDELAGWWTDAGTLSSLRLAGDLAFAVADDLVPPQAVTPCG